MVKSCVWPPTFPREYAWWQRKPLQVSACVMGPVKQTCERKTRAWRNSRNGASLCMWIKCSGSGQVYITALRLRLSFSYNFFRTIFCLCARFSLVFMRFVLGNTNGKCKTWPEHEIPLPSSFYTCQVQNMAWTPLCHMGTVVIMYSSWQWLLPNKESLCNCLDFSFYQSLSSTYTHMSWICVCKYIQHIYMFIQ